VSSEEVGTLPHTLETKLERPSARIETDPVVGHTNQQGIVVVLKVNASNVRRRMTDHVTHCLLDDSEGSELGVGSETHRDAGDLEIHTKGMGVLDVREQAAYSGDQAKLVQSRRSQTASHVSKTFDNLEQLDTALKQRCGSGARPPCNDQAIHATGEVNQPLKRVIVDLVSDVPSLLLMRREQARCV
jgi:hypothetical protein